jgi:hypothetical protein
MGGVGILQQIISQYAGIGFWGPSFIPFLWHGGPTSESAAMSGTVPDAIILAP